MQRHPTLLLAGAALAAVGIAGCGSSSGSSAGATSTSSTAASSAGTAASGKVINAAASINAWGSILQQLGGTHVRTTSIITNPDTDPHATSRRLMDGRTIADAQLFVENGIGYDAWAAKAVAANPDPKRTVINVGELVDVAAGGNPHRWYSPPDVEKVADTITADLKKARPRRRELLRHPAPDVREPRPGQVPPADRRHQGEVRRHPGRGQREHLRAARGRAGSEAAHPASFLKAISEGTDPVPADKSTIDAQITNKKIKVYVFNSQNSTPDVAAQVDGGEGKGIPVAAVTETLSPAGARFQDWQVAQLDALAAALAQATGK